MMRGKLHGKFRSWRFFFIDEGETKLAPFITVFASTPPRVNGEMFLKRNFHSRRACNVIANMTRYKYQRFRFLMSFAFWSKETKYRKHSTESKIFDASRSRLMQKCSKKPLIDFYFRQQKRSNFLFSVRWKSEIEDISKNSHANL